VRSLHELSELRIIILRLEYFLSQRANGTDDPGLRMQQARASQIQQLVGSARSFHSSASTIEANRPTISEGSIADFPLHSDQRQQISDWIQLPTISDKDLEWNPIPSQSSGSDIDAELPARVTSLAPTLRAPSVIERTKFPSASFQS